MSDATPSSPRRSRRELWPLAILIIVFVVLVWPPVLLNAEGTNEAFDQRVYHLPLIQSFADSLPGVDLRHYNSATAPGYHLALAVIATSISDDVRLLRFVGSLFSLGLIIAIWTIAVRWTDPWIALVLLLPLVCSSYFLGAAVWLTTDNAALLFVVLSLGGSISLSMTAIRAARWSVYAAAAVFIRQIHIWCVVTTGTVVLLQMPIWSKDRAWSAWLASAMPLLIPLSLLAMLVVLWGGLTPPAYTAQHNAGANLASIILTLAVTGVFGAPLLPLIAERPLIRRFTPRILLTLTIAALLVVLIPTSYARDAGRWGGSLWEIVARTPTIADRSVVLSFLAIAGAVVLVILYSTAVERKRIREANLIGLAMLVWSIAQAMNSQAWQRYVEPLAIVFLIWLVCLGIVREKVLGEKWRWGGLILITCLQAASATWKMYIPMMSFSAP